MMEKIREEIKKYRTFNYPLHPLIQNRWSPRSMSGEEMSDEELMPLFEAARWAPSCYNNQPWRFIYAKRNTPAWGPIFDLMVEFNQSWTKNAAALVVVVSKNVFDHNGKPCVTHSYDTGSAWMSLALEGTYRGYVVHGMQGFDYAKAKIALNIPDNHSVEAMCAIGKPAAKEKLSDDLQKKEFPSSRRPLTEVVMEGSFRAN